MPQCNVTYIPEHLHQQDRTIIPDFFESEKLYWRLGDHPPVAPYSKISLYDISCNRSGEENSLSMEDDVLWNIDPNKPFQRYQSEITTLSVRKLAPETPTSITIQNPQPSTGLYVTMSLIHDPLPCNYAHTMFVFDLIDGTRVTKENYSETFQKKPYKRLRQSCRDILHKAVIRKEIDF